MYESAIVNGVIVDGSRRKPYEGTVYVKDGKIAKISTETGSPEPSEKVIDACGHIVAPGFLNIHCHSDKSYLACPTYESMLTSGVTFELGGQCGLSCVPVSEKNFASQASLGGLLVNDAYDPASYRPTGMKSYKEDVENTGITVNVGMMIGHGALRSAIVGWDQRPLTEEEMEKMCALLDSELKEGALGVSFGLIYPPGSFCDTEEIKALARVCAKNGKVLAVHMRNENVKVFEALSEMIDVAVETGVRLEISHLKLMGKKMWGKAGELLAKIDMARAKGVSIHCDQYPYNASHSGLQSSLPKEAVDGGYDRMVENLADDAWWDRISCHGMLPELENRGGAENVTVNELLPTAKLPEIIGKNLVEIAEMYSMSVSDAVRYILRECGGRIQCVYHNMSMEDVLTIMSQRDISVISDGTAYAFSNHSGVPHPRNAGTFARFFRLVREHDLMPIEDAVYKVTGLPSTVIGTDDQFGFIREGYDATFTIFDKDTVTDCATYENPDVPSLGFDYVIVNGEIVLDHGKITDARPGKVILR